jgi:signal transduction histidine kinase
MPCSSSPSLLHGGCIPVNSEILVVDDSACSRNLIARTLAAEGYAVRLAANGSEALEMAVQSPPPALILLDIQMPSVSGYEVCRQLKSHAATQSIPVIFMTASEDEEAHHHAFEVGAADYIHKPVQARVMLSRVKTHLALSRHRHQLHDQLAHVLEQSPIPFLFVDRTGTVVHANTASAGMFGYSGISPMSGLALEELVGIDTTRVWPPTSAQSLYPVAPHPMHISVECTRQGGAAFTAEAGISFIDSPDGTLMMIVLQDVSAHTAALSSLGDSCDLIRKLATQNELAREQERKHISREVHDELGQVLSALRLDLTQLRKDYQRDQPALGERLLGLRRLVDRGILTVRDIAAHLRPAALDLGLLPALEWLKDDFAVRNHTVCTLDYHAPALEISEQRALLVYRIVQESLNNITKHASARRVAICLNAGSYEVLLSIEDDGVGFDTEARPICQTYGLLGMRERANALDGSLHIRSTPGQGSCVTLAFPLQTASSGR